MYIPFRKYTKMVQIIFPMFSADLCKSESHPSLLVEHCVTCDVTDNVKCVECAADYELNTEQTECEG